jgi:hypothetical protein
MAEKDFDVIYQKLREIALKAAQGLVIKHDQNGLLYMVAPDKDLRGREIYFGGTQIKKNYVSYHLMAVYMNPELLDGISDKLRKRMQGKSCFNFRKPDQELFAELDQLTQKSLTWFKDEGSKFLNQLASGKGN